MRIAIAGAGNVGRAIARELLGNGHQVLLIDKDPKALKLETIHTRRFGASEDAGFLIERVQQNGGEAAYLILGANLAAPHHHPEFDFDEAVLAPGVALLEAWLLSRLGT